MYVTELVVANTVNTMPEKTMQAFADHGELQGDKVSGTEAEAQQVLDDLAAVGHLLRRRGRRAGARRGARSSTPPGRELVETVQTALDEAKDGRRQPGPGRRRPTVDDDVV